MEEKQTTSNRDYHVRHSVKLPRFLQREHPRLRAGHSTLELDADFTDLLRIIIATSTSGYQTLFTRPVTSHRRVN